MRSPCKTETFCFYRSSGKFGTESFKGGIYVDKNLIDEILKEIGLEHIEDDDG